MLSCEASAETVNDKKKKRIATDGIVSKHDRLARQTFKEIQE